MNLRRRGGDVKISLLPRWAEIVATIAKWFLYTIPFICCSIAMWLEGGPLSNSYVLTAVWCLSLLKLVEYIDGK